MNDETPYRAERSVDASTVIPPPGGTGVQRSSVRSGDAKAHNVPRHPRDVDGKTWRTLRDLLVRSEGGVPPGYRVLPVYNRNPRPDERWEDVLVGWRAVKTSMQPDDSLGTHGRDGPRDEDLAQACREACRMCHAHHEEHGTSDLPMLESLGLIETETEGPVDFDFRRFVRGRDGWPYVSRKDAYSIFAAYRRRHDLLVSPSDTAARHLRRWHRDGHARMVRGGASDWPDVGSLCAYAANLEPHRREEAAILVLGASLEEIAAQAAVPSEEQMRTVVVPQRVVESLLRSHDFLVASVPLDEGKPNADLVRELRRVSEEAHFHLGTSYADEYPEDRRADLDEIVGNT